MPRPTALLAALALLTAMGSAQQHRPVLNEIYSSQSGLDDQEFIELSVSPGLSLTNSMVLVIDGAQGSPTPGHLIAAWDLTGLAIPADGYLVLGDAAVPGVDLVIGTSETLPDTTATYMTFYADLPAAVLAQVGNSVDPELDGTTVLEALGRASDRVTLAGPGIGSGDLAFDGSGWVGPDAASAPAGIFRSNDYDNSWCNSAFLDFDALANANAPRTPGAMNTGCSDPLDTVTYCTAGFSQNACQTKLWSTGVASSTAASGFHLYAGSISSKGSTTTGLFFYGVNGRQANQWGNGTSFQCVIPPVKRGPILTGTSWFCEGVLNWDLNARFAQKPAHNPGAGALMQAQFWYRDQRNTSNEPTSMSNAIEFTVQ